MALIRPIASNNLDKLRINAASSASATGERTSDTFTYTLTKTVEYVLITFMYNLERTYSIASTSGVTNISGAVTTNHGGAILVKLEGNIGDSKTITVTFGAGQPSVLLLPCSI